MAEKEQLSFQQIQDSTQAFLQVLLKLEQRTLKDCKVASLGFIKQYDATSRIAKVELFPKYEDESYQMIEVYNALSASISTNDMVVVLFTDRFSLDAITQHTKGIAQSNLNSQSEIHSLMNGIIILKVS